MRRRLPIFIKNDPSSQNTADGWQLVYTGFILILLCFFIMLTSFASLQGSKVTRFVQSFSNAVSVFNGGKSLEAGETIFDSDAMVVDKEDPMAQLFAEVKRLGAQNGLEGVQVERKEDGVVMTLSETMLFASGDAELSREAFPLLEKISRAIKEMKVQVEIQGHTDNRPIRTPKYASNWELSTDRAVNVLRYMIADGGVQSRKLLAVGFSKYHPIVPNTSSFDQAKNRRVEFVFRPE